MKRSTMRILSFLLILSLVVSLFASTLTVSAATNRGTRHELCTSLSSQAKAYYTGNYTYEKLSVLGGDNSGSSLKAMDSQLFGALHDLMDDTMTDSVSYNSLTSYWPDTDANNGSSDAVLFYSDVVSSSYNREHVWPKSRASFYQRNGGSDLHHLRPTNSKVNSTRGNLTMGNVVGVISSYETYSYSGKTVLWYSTSADLVEVADNIKGDVARIMLYVWCRWEQPNLFEKVSSSNLPAFDSDDDANNGLAVMESMKTLLQWCEEDPVDEWEMGRNDCIEDIQGNRNVFIDYPEYAWLLFEQDMPEDMPTPSGEAQNADTCDHVWDEGVVTKEVTCTEDGEITYTCGICGKIKTTVISAPGHSMSGDVCTVCGYERKGFVGELTDPTTLADGDRVLIYFPSGHSLITNVESSSRLAPTEDVDITDSNAVTEVRTETESAVFTIVKNQNGSVSFADAGGKLMTSGSTGNSMTMQAGASACANWTFEAASGGWYVHNEGAAYQGKYNQYLEYYSGGFTTYGLGSGGANYIFQFYKLPADAPECEHAWDEGEVTAEPTCAEDGEMTYTCTLCGETETEAIPALGHSYEAVGTEPTCTEGGFSTYTCSVCGDSYTVNGAPALGHVWDEGEVTAEPTCAEDGEMTYTCTRCGETETEAIPALGHSYEEVVTEPTCTESGFTTYTCSSCGDSYTSDETAALGHDYIDGICNRCGEEDPNYVPEDPVDPPVVFDDVSDDAWYADAVEFAVRNGLFNGMSATTFEPETAMTRAMLVTVLWRYACQPKEGTNVFTDVPEGEWYTDAVAWAAYNNIVGGVGDNKFDPNGNITREQMATILYRYTSGQGIDTSARADLSSFPDAGNVSSYAEDPICWAVAEGLINGSDGKLLPQGNATRAQVATILMRFIENIVG